jgi:hypothetical protein
VLAFVRPENIDVLQNGLGRDQPGALEGTVEQIDFEGPTVRFAVDAGRTPFKVTIGGRERLTLLDAADRRVRLSLHGVSLVRAGA